MSHQPKKCAHPSCTCMVDKDKYCSQHCKDAKGVTALACHCHHAECKG
jgi:hypothetical protein